jgi:hypothetical protein
MKMKNKWVVILALVAVFGIARADVVALVGWNTGTPSEWTFPHNADYINSGTISSAQWVSHVGFTPYNDSRGFFTDWDAIPWSFELNYFEWTVSAAPGKTIQWDRFMGTYSAAGGGQVARLSSSHDNFAAVLGTITNNSYYENHTLDISDLVTTGDVTFRLAFDNGSGDPWVVAWVGAPSAYSGYDPLMGNRTLTMTGTEVIPEPASALLVGCGAALIGLYRRCYSRD